MKKAAILGLLLLALCIGAAAAEDSVLLGRPFPDFSVTDTEGNPFTLSEALKDHEAAVINIWASWCPWCIPDMQFLSEAYSQYGDRVAFIALSCDPNDTDEVIKAFDQALNVPFPLGRDEDGFLYFYLGFSPIPATVVVDRFGNAGFVQIGSFRSSVEVNRILEAFLGDGYTETVVLTDIPQNTATYAFPFSESTAIYVENENAKPISIWIEGYSVPQPACVVYDDLVHLRIEAAASDRPADMLLLDESTGMTIPLPKLLDQQQGALRWDIQMPAGEAAEPFIGVALHTDQGVMPYSLFLIDGEDHIEALMEGLRGSGYSVSWEYGDAAPEKAPPEAYILHVTDQNGVPVPGVYVNFCTDNACSMAMSDENGIIAFTGAQEDYHVKFLRAPAGYRFDSDFELYTGRAHGEWLLRIWKDQ